MANEANIRQLSDVMSELQVELQVITSATDWEATRPTTKTGKTVHRELCCCITR